jgi:hypothetical protein
MNSSRRSLLEVLFALPWMGIVSTQANAQTSATDLLKSISGPEAVQALRDSLEQGARNAIASLGRENGYFANPKLKIGLPKNFTKADRFLRSLGHGKKIDDLILAMNRAAEAAAPQAQGLVLDAVHKMTVNDAKAILTGGDNAATDYFRKATESQLAETLLPVVKSVTEKSDLARSYNALAGTLAKFGVNSEQGTIESYVNKKALNGIYVRIGEEERSLRANPTQYTGSLLGKVFGLLK